MFSSATQRLFCFATLYLIYFMLQVFMFYILEMEWYPIKEKGCGPCLIINNYTFDRNFNREGTNADENRLRDVFQWLGCEVICHRDAASSDIDDILRDLCEKDHSNTDVVVLCILSHGSLGKVYGVDDSSVEIQDILEM